LFIHQHELGTSSRAVLHHLQGDADCLLEHPRWDFHWQSGFFFTEPKRVSPGDIIDLECQWDNSAAHQRVVDGMPLVPSDVNWGGTAADEMCLGAFFWSPAP